MRVALFSWVMPPKPAQELSKLCADYWETTLKFNPTWATFLGDNRYNDQLPDVGPNGRSAEQAAVKGFLSRLKKLDASKLDQEQQITADILKLRLELALEGIEHKLYQWEIDQLSGPQVWLLELVNFAPFKTERDVDDFCSRLEKFPHYMDQYLGNLREGMEQKRTSPKVAWQRVLGQLQELTGTDTKQFPLFAAAKKIPAAWPSKDRLEKRLKDAILGSVLPSYWKMQKFLTEKYAPVAREKVGVCYTNGGQETYRFLISLHTTTRYTAKQLHEIGLEEMAGIQKEMKAIAKRKVKDFVEALKLDPRNFFADKASLLEEFRRILKKVDARLPDFFGRLPKTGYEVKAIEEYREKDAPAAYYYPIPEDGSRLGIFYANTYQPETRPKYNMPALAVHEAVPGHHLQIAIATELQDLPKFRRHGGFTAFVEGWALYTERLAEEMGIYESDLERFGMLNYQAWRAARLVVDTGIHAFKWTREKAIEYFQDHLGISEGETANEIDRYIIWPGQALAYKVGQREIASLRRKAEKALGSRFHLRDFHDEVLRHGGVPLTTLGHIIDTWIGGKK